MPLAGFARYVRKPAGAMPPYSARVVSDAQLADIYAYLKTIPKPPDAKSIPLLNQQ
jgi:ubiquinol-cytochrome c reductase cytochrome c subunit